jgi:hypothetical protein
MLARSDLGFHPIKVSLSMQATGMHKLLSSGCPSESDEESKKGEKKYRVLVHTMSYLNAFNGTVEDSACDVVPVRLKAHGARERPFLDAVTRLMNEFSHRPLLAARILIK